MNRILYQTVEDRNNPDDIESYGPHYCKDQNAWLGFGYYFWDSIIDLAHWWGKLRYPKTGYIICQSSLSEGGMKRVYDLVGRPELLVEIQELAEIIRKHTGAVSIYVPEIIEYMKKRTSFLSEYSAIRAYPLETLPKSEEMNMRFNSWNRAFIDLRPAIQFCFFDKSLLNDDFHIVYPEIYCSEMVM